MGRRTKLLNNNTKDIILKYISNGNYIRTACLAAGIPEQRFYDWMQKADNPIPECDIYRDFREAVKNAEARAEAEIVTRVYDAGLDKRNWPANMTMLERKHPERWGRRDALEIGPSKVLVALRERMATFQEVKEIEVGNE